MPPKGSRKAKVVTPTAAAQRTKRGRKHGDPDSEKRLEDPEVLIRKGNRIAKARKGSATRRQPSKQSPKEPIGPAGPIHGNSQTDAAAAAPISPKRDSAAAETESNNVPLIKQEEEQQPVETTRASTEQAAVTSPFNSVPSGRVDNAARVDETGAGEKKRKRDDDHEHDGTLKYLKTDDEERKKDAEVQPGIEPVEGNNAQPVATITSEPSIQSLSTTPWVPQTPPPTSNTCSKIPEASIQTAEVIYNNSPCEDALVQQVTPPPPPVAPRTGSFLGSLLGELGGAPIKKTDNWRPPGRMTRRPSSESKTRTNSQQARDHTNQAREFQGLPRQPSRASSSTVSHPSISSGITPMSRQLAAATSNANDDSDASNEDDDDATKSAPQPSLRDRLLATTDGPKALQVDDNEDHDEHCGADQELRDENSNYSPPVTSPGFSLAEIVDREQQRQSSDHDSSETMLEQELEAALNCENTPEVFRQRSSVQQTEGRQGMTDHHEDDQDVSRAFEAAGRQFNHTAPAKMQSVGFSRVLASQLPTAPAQPLPTSTQAYDYENLYSEEDLVDYDDDDFDAIYHRE